MKNGFREDEEEPIKRKRKRENDNYPDGNEETEDGKDRRMNALGQFVNFLKWNCVEDVPLFLTSNKFKEEQHT